MRPNVIRIDIETAKRSILKMSFTLFRSIENVEITNFPKSLYIYVDFSHTLKSRYLRIF